MAKAPQLNRMATGETRNCRVSFLNKLDSGEVISPTSSVSVSIVQGTSALVLSSIGVSTGALTVNGSSNTAGQVVTFIATASIATRYELRVQAATDAGQTVSTICPLVVEASS